MHDSLSGCLNCGQNLENGENFCSHCGQKSATHRLTLHELAHDAIHYFTHADKSIFSLLKDLLMKPGVVAREYVDGRRQSYFKPLNFFLIVAGLLVFMTTQLYRPNTGQSAGLRAYAAKQTQPQVRHSMMAQADRVDEVTRITGKYSNVIYMIATPLSALFFWLFFYRRRFNYMEHLVANMYFISYTMIIYALVAVPIRYYGQSAMIAYTILGAFFLFEVIYRGFAYRQFLDVKGWKGVLWCYGSSLLMTALWTLLTGTLISQYIQKGW